MISRFRRLLARRPRSRLIYRFALPPCHGTGATVGRELVVVLSPTVPHFQRLTVYRRPAAGPADPPQAA